jgi:signal transduction histidine kinase
MVVDAFSLPDFYKQESLQNDLYSVNLIIQVLLYLWVLVSWLEGRESLSARFLIKQAVLIVHTFCFFGYHRMLFGGLCDPIYFDRIFSCLNLCLIPVALWFESSLLNEYTKPKVFNVIFLVIFGLSLLNVLSLAFDASWLGVLMRNNLLGILTALSFSLAATFIKPLPRSELSSPFVLKKSWVIAYFYMLMIVTGFGSLGAAGYINMQEITLHSSVVYSLMSGFAMSFLLQYRNLQIRRVHIQTSSQLELVSKQAQFERERKDEQKHFLGMLMHELKNPLSVIDMSMSIQRAKGEFKGADASVSRAISDIKSIIDRCIEFDQLDENLSVPRKENINLSKLVRELIAQDVNRGVAWTESIQSEIRILADVHYLSVVLNNLIDNARKYRAKDSAIEIAVGIANEGIAFAQKGVFFTIANQVGNSGFPDSNRIFEKYYRSPGAMKSSGTGLGLFLVSNLSQKMGIHCQYVPTPELVRFELWFPN